MPRRARHAVALVGVLVVTVACHSEAAVQPAPPPDASPSCNHPPDIGGDDGQRGDSGLGAGFDYSDARNDFGAAATMTLCMNTTGPVRITGTSPRISVEPEVLQGEGPLFTFSVTVAPGGSGHLEIELLNNRGEVGTSFNGPAVTSDGAGWAFVG